MKIKELKTVIHLSLIMGLMTYAQYGQANLNYNMLSRLTVVNNNDSSRFLAIRSPNENFSKPTVVKAEWAPPKPGGGVDAAYYTFSLHMGLSKPISLPAYHVHEIAITHMPEANINADLEEMEQKRGRVAALLHWVDYEKEFGKQASQFINTLIDILGLNPKKLRNLPFSYDMMYTRWEDDKRDREFYTYHRAPPKNINSILVLDKNFGLDLQQPLLFDLVDFKTSKNPFKHKHLVTKRHACKGGVKPGKNYIVVVDGNHCDIMEDVK